MDKITVVCHKDHDKGYEDFQGKCLLCVVDELMLEIGSLMIQKQRAEKREWVGLNSFDRTLLRTTYAPLKTLHHIKETDTTIVAEVVNDWEAFFTAIEEALKEKNT